LRFYSRKTFFLFPWLHSTLSQYSLCQLSLLCYRFSLSKRVRVAGVCLFSVLYRICLDSKSAWAQVYLTEGSYLLFFLSSVIGSRGFSLKIQTLFYLNIANNQSRLCLSGILARGNFFIIKWVKTQTQFNIKAANSTLTSHFSE